MKNIIKYIFVFFISFISVFCNWLDLNILYTIPLLAFFMFNGINSFLFSLFGLIIGSSLSFKIYDNYIPIVYLSIALCIYFVFYHILLLFNKKLIINYFISSIISILFTYLLYLLTNDNFVFSKYVYLVFIISLITLMFSFLLKKYSFYLNTYNDDKFVILSYLLSIIYISNVSNIYNHEITKYITICLILISLIIFTLKEKILYRDNWF